MSLIFLAIGLLLVIEGLALALAPSRIEDLLHAFAEMPVDTRRLIGLAAVAAGVVIVWLVRQFGAG
jgi:uncharacterized protein YjeT (DUF2065 family)